MADDAYNLRDALTESLNEIKAWKRGEVELPSENVDPMPPARIRAIRKSLCKSTREFEARFGISSGTMNNWEQGRRKPDATAQILLKVIEIDPDAVEQAAHSA